MSVNRSEVKPYFTDPEKIRQSDLGEPETTGNVSNIPGFPFPVKPLSDQDLQGATVLASNVLDAQNLVSELADIRDGQAIHLRTLASVTKIFGELVQELSTEVSHRRHLDASIRRAEREAARLKIPLWFWRAEPGIDLKTQLFRRACCLIHDLSLGPDDTWDLMKEYLTDWAKPDPFPTDDQLVRLIEHAKKKGGPDYARA